LYSVRRPEDRHPLVRAWAVVQKPVRAGAAITAVAVAALIGSVIVIAQALVRLAARLHGRHR
jgi:uncharacterized membrane protein YcjF (UPF0283 family)